MIKVLPTLIFPLAIVESPIVKVLEDIPEAALKEYTDKPLPDMLPDTFSVFDEIIFDEILLAIILPDIAKLPPDIAPVTFTVFDEMLLAIMLPETDTLPPEIEPATFHVFDDMLFANT